MLMEDQRDSYSQFYERNANLVYAVALSYLRHREDAEDCSADVFAQVFEQKLTFESIEHERAWLVTAVRNRCRNRVKHWFQSRRDEMPENGRSDEAAVQLRMTMDAIAEMPEKYRLPLVLCAVQGYSTAETAKMLQTNESTITTRISRARKILRKKLEGGEMNEA